MAKLLSMVAGLRWRRKTRWWSWAPTPWYRRWRGASKPWLVRYRRTLLFGGAAVLLAGATAATVIIAFPGVYGGSSRRGAASSITGNEAADQTLLGCVRGATAAALSAAVPAAPLAATGILIPGSAALVATASAIGCGVGAVTTTTTSGFSWMMQQGRGWFSGWFGR